MRDNRHGGDAFRYGKGITDFSANINPLGAPDEVIRAFREADVSVYPDPYSESLRNAIADMTGADADDIICGSGAASLIFTLTACLKPKKTLIAAPSFSEYGRASECMGSEIIYYNEREGASGMLSDDTDLLFICVPNNPTGTLKERNELEEIIAGAARLGIFVVVDECFNDFLDEPERYSVSDMIGEYRNLAILRSFTKMYAIPGLRLGYMLCSDRAVLSGMYSSRQPWEISAPAEAAGIAACGAREHVKKTREYIKAEREFLKSEFKRLGIEHYEPTANFMFFKHRAGLREELLKYGILIRSCANYRDLDERSYRTAVRLHEENMMLIKALEEIDG